MFYFSTISCVHCLLVTCHLIVTVFKHVYLIQNANRYTSLLLWYKIVYMCCLAWPLALQQ